MSGQLPGVQAAAGSRDHIRQMSWQAALERTVTGMGYDLVDVERSAGGLLRVTIDRVPGKVYASGDSEFITVDDCELVTRQLQYALEVDGVAYERLEVSSPGLDRPLKKPADYVRFAGEQVELTLKLAFQGRKKYQGLLRPAESGEGFELVFRDGKEDKVLGFALEEVRDCRLVPVVDFKGRKLRAPAPVTGDGAASSQESGGHEE